MIHLLTFPSKRMTPIHSCQPCYGTIGGTHVIKPRSDTGTKRRHSVSTSSGLPHRSSFHFNDDDENDRDNKGTSNPNRSLTLSPTSLHNSFPPLSSTIYQEPAGNMVNLREVMRRQEIRLNRQASMHEEQRSGLKSIKSTLRKLGKDIKNSLNKLILLFTSMMIALDDEFFHPNVYE
ncbi:hypothetical protein Tco_0356566 [Tanacetum coccineum]